MTRAAAPHGLCRDGSTSGWNAHPSVHAGLAAEGLSTEPALYVTHVATCFGGWTPELERMGPEVRPLPLSKVRALRNCSCNPGGVEESPRGGRRTDQGLTRGPVRCLRASACAPSSTPPPHTHTGGREHNVASLLLIPAQTCR